MKPLPRYFDGIRVPKYVFFMSLGMLMLLSGVHVGLILLLYRINVDSIVLVHIVLGGGGDRTFAVHPAADAQIL